MITDLSEFTVGPDATLIQTIEAINRGAKQIALVVADGKLLGTVTDGDVRRGLPQHLDGVVLARLVAQLL